MISLLVIVASISCMAQGSKEMRPLVVLPSDTWMNDNDFAKKGENGATTMDYSKALNNPNMASAIKNIESMFTERGYSIVSSAVTLKELGENNDFDKMLSKLNPKLIVYVDLSVRSMGPRKTIALEMKAIDAKSKGMVASVSENGEPSLDPVELALRKMIASRAEDFTKQIQEYLRQ